MNPKHFADSAAEVCFCFHDFVRVPEQFGMAALQRYDVEERGETWKQYEAMVGVGESGFSSGARGTSWHSQAKRLSASSSCKERCRRGRG